MPTQRATYPALLISPLRNLLTVLVFVFSVCVYATLAYHAAGWSWTDAIYMVTLTIYTVGYQEVRPIDTPYLHFVTISTIIMGCTGMIVLTGVMVQVFTEFQIKRVLGLGRMEKEIDKLKDHVIICGYGRIGLMLARDLDAVGRPCVVIERDAAKHAEAMAAGFMSITGDATEESVLREAGIERARVLATVLPNDAANMFITLTARSLNTTIEIIARGESPSTENKLIHAGANKVVLPAHIGAERIAEMILFPETANFLRETAGMREIKRSLSDFGLEVEAVRVAPDGALTGLTVGDAERESQGAFFIVQIDKAGGQSLQHPTPETLIEADDRVVLVARAGHVGASVKFSAPRSPVRVGRGMV